MKKSLLLLVLIIGLLLRVIGSDWGFPFLLHPDENVVANMPADMAKRSSLDPGEYNHPDHFDIYANALLYHTASNLVYHQPLTESFGEHTLLYYRISRIFVALLGTACIWVAYLIGCQFSANTGLIAAALVAFFPAYVSHSHYITADIPLVLFLLSVILFTLKYLNQPSNRNLLLAALFSALSVSVKYPGVLSLPLILAAVGYRQRTDLRRAAIDMGKAVGGFILFLFLVSPYLIINFDEVIDAVTTNAYPIHLGADGLGWFGNVVFYAKTWYEMAGFLLTLFFLAGSYLVLKKEKAFALPLFFGLVYWLGLSKIGLHWERWAFPMFTCPLIVAAYGIDRLFQGARSLGRFLPAAVCAAAGFTLFGLVTASAAVTANYTLKDTRYVSFLFTQQAGISEKNTLYEGFSPFYPSNMRDGSVRNAYFLHDRNKEIHYVIVSSGLYDRYRSEPQKYQVENAFYDQVFALPLVKKFAGKEYLAGPGLPFYLNNDLARNLAFLADYARSGGELVTGPAIQIYRYQTPGFLEHEKQN